jgi:signal transduction histidine kinase
MTIRLQLFIGFFILFLLFVINFFITQRLSQDVLKNTSYINNSEAVIRNSNQIHKIMIDMQSGYRGYLLTGQSIFLDSYYEGIERVPPLMNEQKALTNGAIQQRTLDSILHYHYEWVGYANQLIITHQDSMEEASKKYRELFEQKLKRGVGKKMNDKIRELFVEFDSVEYLIRKQRREALECSISNTRKVTLLLTLLSIALSIISGFYLIRTISNRISLMVRFAGKISAGHFHKIHDNTRDELRRLSESLNSMSETLEKSFNELRKKNTELDQFAYVVSHDLKAPLRGIANLTSWMEEDYESEMTVEMKKNLALIKGRTERLENMINGLLEYARIGRTRKDIERIDIRTLLDEQIDILVPANFSVDISGTMPEIHAVRVQVEQVFSNLISNAIKYNNKPDGKIEIRGSEGDEYFIFEVEDNGQGIQEQYFEKIFVIFQTLRERDAFESTGVGLAIVKKIMEDIKGSVSVKSEYGKGTTFTVKWPKNINY